MNKYKRVESRRVKYLLYLFKLEGYDFKYGAVRRKMRKLDRVFDKISESPKRLNKGFRRLDYETKKYWEEHNG